MRRPPLDLPAAHGGWRIDVVDATGSTNADLLARHAGGADITGAALFAEYQSAGRGRNGRSWSAPPRSQIALSVGVGADGVPPEAWGWLPLLTGVALVDAVRATTGIEAGVKWPNDILVGTGKLAGILAEVAAPDPVIVVGLGLNVTLTAAEAPDPRATTADAGRRGPRPRRAGHRDPGPAERTHRTLAAHARPGPDAGGRLPHAQPDRWQPGAGAAAGDREIIGTATEVDESGRLLIDTDTDVVTVSAGDITHLRPAN